ncbi:SDR family oxidoreductase [Natronomonas gomsonensis]|uniref:SDR family oxidoreductase n=1 Tax=Natronomonas gomsonensis TaxID=1046043 RepID=UPI0020CA8234|nr:SDR family oxidoreductase [Natronomonas gomsonensis]MCY4732437.1 SDR family oxidoreductase [Natronomonas gomsonensis]
MDVLVTGAGGLLGSNVAAVAADRGYSVLGTYHNREPELDVETAQLDITDADQFAELFATHAFDAVINCAAMTDVDGCEQHSEQARRVNGNAPGEMASIAAQHGIDFVQISTDYVFDGRRDGRYAPGDETNPIQEYGRSKALGEETVRDGHPEALIVRLSFVYGRNNQGTIEGFPAWVLDRLAREESTPLFTDQFITPTRAGSAAETTLDLSREATTGTVHVAAQDCVTPFELGTTLAELAGEPVDLLEEGRMADVDRPAVRPKNTCLAVEQTESLLGRAQPTLEEDLLALL